MVSKEGGQNNSQVFELSSEVEDSAIDLEKSGTAGWKSCFLSFRLTDFEVLVKHTSGNIWDSKKKSK